jgi:SAM-dependent methyltransferase
MRFSFGKNWLSFSEKTLNETRIASARAAFRSLFQGIEMNNARFLDIGFGQGLALFLAAELGAEVLGIDVDPLCLQALQRTQRFFRSIAVPPTRLVSILDDEFVRDQEAKGGFDVVHSWGVLHHSGDMLKAFRNAAVLVKKGGFLIISIYHKHWTSPLWRAAKFIFNHVPRLLQESIVLMLYPAFHLRARSLSGNDSPLASRGMDLRHDIRDWLGGYPYEFSSPREVEEYFGRLGFRLIRCLPTKGFTGCNEFVFQNER